MKKKSSPHSIKFASQQPRSVPLAAPREAMEPVPDASPAFAPAPPPPPPAIHAVTRPSPRAVDGLAKRWLLIVAVAACTTLLAWLFAVAQPKRFRASSVAAVTPVVEGLEATEVLRGVDTLERRTLVSTVAALASTPLTHAKTVPPHAHGYIIEAVVMPNTNLLRVNVEGENPRIAADVANRVPDVIGPQARSLYKYYGVTMVSPAVAPEQPFLPRVGRTVAAGLLIGLILGAIIAYTIHQRHPAAVR